MILTGKRTCPSAILPTTNPTRTGLRMSRCLHGERPATNSPISDQNLFTVLADFDLVLIS
jgi:hypothetical protein